jgi:hypothetical protein
MISTALYTNVSNVAQALAFQSPEVLNNAVTAGSTSISLNQAPPPDWTVGSSLIIDVNNPTVSETVTIQSVSGNSIAVSALANNHSANAPVINVTILQNYVKPASRWFDSLTHVPAGFAYEQVTETKTAYIDNKGYIVIPLSKPVVTLSDVTIATFKINPVIPAINLDLTKSYIEDSYFLKVMPDELFIVKSGIATVTYSGGYNPLPDDIVLAATMLAARLYKERDSGYSDAVGNTDLGILQYKHAIPTDIIAIVQRYRRWTV